jgi:hypothetical protein
VHSSASGIRHDLIPMSNRYTFIAGVLLGIAGGALIPFAQALLRSSATPSTLERPNETHPRRVEPQSYDPLRAPATVPLTASVLAFHIEGLRAARRQ